MSDARTARKIAMLQNTLDTNADVLSPAQIDSLKATIASLKATGEAFPGATAARLGMVTARIADSYPVPVTPADVQTPVLAAATMPAPAPPAAPVAAPAPAPADDWLATARPTAASLTAGRAKFDARSADGKVFTFEIAKPDRFKGEYFASVFHVEQGKFLYVAMMNGDGKLRFTKGSKFTDSDLQARVLSWALGKVFSGAAIPPGYSIVERDASPAPARTGYRGYNRRRANPYARSGAAALRRAAVTARNMGVGA